MEDYRELPTAVPNCPFCRTQDTYEPTRGTVPASPKFLNYIVPTDDKADCKNMRRRKRFEISAIKTMALV